MGQDDNDYDKLARLGLVLKHYGDRSAASVNKMEDTAASFERIASSMNATLANLKDELVDGVRSEIGQVARQSFDEAIAGAREQLADEAHALRKQREALRAEREAMRTERHRWLIYGYGGPVICMLAALAAITAWGARTMSEAEDARAELKWIESVNRSDFIPCRSESGTCASVDTGAEPIQGQYLPVKPRP